jgi:hypothetical protein
LELEMLTLASVTESLTAAERARLEELVRRQRELVDAGTADSASAATSYAGAINGTTCAGSN